jgi:hypothetical protein
MSLPPGCKTREAITYAPIGNEIAALSQQYRAPGVRRAISSQIPHANVVGKFIFSRYFAARLRMT